MLLDDKVETIIGAGEEQETFRMKYCQKLSIKIAKEIVIFGKNVQINLET